MEGNVFITTDVKCELCDELISWHSKEGFSCGDNCGRAILHESLMQVFSESLEKINNG
jgi:hypothetical protein